MADIQDFQQYVQIQCEKERRETIGHMAAGTANIILNPLAVIKGTLQLLEKSLKDHVSVLQFAASPPHQKRAALQEIIDNALDASPPGSVLTLRTHITDNHIQIIVRDQGAGIPKDLQPRIITPFVTSKPDAIGFGLSFSYAMIEKMGGTLNIESSDAGTSVIVQLPASTGV